jgi:hypothetical protein
MNWKSLGFLVLNGTLWGIALNILAWIMNIPVTLPLIILIGVMSLTGKMIDLWTDHLSGD